MVKFSRFIRCPQDVCKVTVAKILKRQGYTKEAMRHTLESLTGVEWYVIHTRIMSIQRKLIDVATIILQGGEDPQRV